MDLVELDIFQKKKALFLGPFEYKIFLNLEVKR